MKEFLKYLANVGVGADIFINVLLGGVPGMTVSMRCARAAGWRQDGRTGQEYALGCFMCWLLNWVVQWNHCPDEFKNTPTPWYDMIRAVIAFAFGFFILYCIIKFMIGGV
jgi:hypothetical protein